MFDKDSFLAGVAVGRRLSIIGSNGGVVPPEVVEISGSQERSEKKEEENMKTNGETY